MKALTPLTPRQRAFLAVVQLKAAMDELGELATGNPLSVTPFIPAIEEAEIELSLLRPRVKMSRSLIHLSGQFGRAP